MIKLEAIVSFLDERTEVLKIRDFPGAYNGLQFKTTAPIRGIAAMVDASLPCMKEGFAQGANLFIVHHGLFWQQPCPIVGPLFEKYRFLIENQCAVYSSHLPLDAHPQIGNNAHLVKLLDLNPIGRFAHYEGTEIGILTEGLERQILKQRLLSFFPELKALEFGPEKAKKMGILSGSGASVMPQLRQSSVDTFITGELRQSHYAQAQEEGLNIYLCGHYSTEVFGVQNLAKESASKFKLPYLFIPSACPL